MTGSTSPLVRSKSTDRRNKAKNWCIDKLVYVIVVAFFAVVLVPQWIAPDLLHMTPEEIAANQFFLSTLAGVIAIPVAAVASRALQTRE